MDPPTSTTQLKGLERPSPVDTPALLDRISRFSTLIPSPPVRSLSVANGPMLAADITSPQSIPGLTSLKTEWAMLLNALEEVAGNPTLTNRRYSPTMRQEYHRLRNILSSSAFDWSILPEHHLSARPWARLREFEVYRDIRSGWVMLVLPLMPSLTRLKIRTIDGFFDHHIQIERIMRDCTHLEHPHISRIDGR
ncbi:hypothetical protein BGZ88_010108 [Linnemannia elongata]|nr:hypothetical protein BGZ88_010108 [Linnemannia elongata]